MSYQVSKLERAILDDVARRTGHAYDRVQSIVPRDQTEAEALLPIVFEWLDRLEAPNYRHALYHSFGVNAARKWISEIVNIWKGECDVAAKGHLVTIILNIATDEDLALIWREMCSADERYPFDSEVLHRMTKSAEFSGLAKDRIATRLSSGRFHASDLWVYSKVTDKRIQCWFAENTEHRDPVVRKVIGKLLKRREQSPEWLQAAHTGPSDATVIFSTEVEVSHLAKMLVQLGREYGFQAPKIGSHAGIFSTFPRDSWHVAVLDKRTQPSAPKTLWFRVEDTDVVEIYLSHMCSVCNEPADAKVH